MERKFQVIEGGRDSRHIRTEDRRSLWVRAVDLGVSWRKLAREFRLQEEDVQAVINAEFAARLDAAERRGFAYGRRSLLTPPPATAARRAA